MSRFNEVYNNIAEQAQTLMQPYKTGVVDIDVMINLLMNDPELIRSLGSNAGALVATLRNPKFVQAYKKAHPKLYVPKPGMQKLSSQHKPNEADDNDLAAAQDQVGFPNALDIEKGTHLTDPKFKRYQNILKNLDK